jgi:hypothetical protein
MTRDGSLVSVRSPPLAANARISELAHQGKARPLGERLFAVRCRLSESLSAPTLAAELVRM